MTDEKIGKVFEYDEKLERTQTCVFCHESLVRQASYTLHFVGVAILIDCNDLWSPKNLQSLFAIVLGSFVPHIFFVWAKREEKGHHREMITVDKSWAWLVSAIKFVTEHHSDVMDSFFISLFFCRWFRSQEIAMLLVSFFAILVRQLWRIWFPFFALFSPLVVHWTGVPPQARFKSTTAIAARIWQQQSFLLPNTAKSCHFFLLLLFTGSEANEISFVQCSCFFDKLIWCQTPVHHHHNHRSHSAELAFVFSFWSLRARRFTFFTVSQSESHTINSIVFVFSCTVAFSYTLIFSYSECVIHTISANLREWCDNRREVRTCAAPSKTINAAVRMRASAQFLWKQECFINFVSMQILLLLWYVRTSRPS